MSDINWDEAPEGCLGAVQLKEEANDYELGIFVTKTKGYMEDGYHYCGHTNVGPQMEMYNFIPRPQPKPIYTQAMSDAGELPSVGMECNISFLYGNTFNKSIITYIGDVIGCYKDNKGKEYTFDTGSVLFGAIDQRTDSEKAIDDIKPYSLMKVKEIETLLSLIKAGKIHGVTFTGEE